MAKVEIYTSVFCGSCHRAKRLLQQKGVEFEEIDVLMHPSRRGEMAERARGGTSVPQIFIDGRHVGGSDRLHELDASGELDRLLAGQA